MKVKSESDVAQSCPTLSDLMDCSLPGSSVHGIFQAKVLEWVAIAFSETGVTFCQMFFLVYRNDCDFSVPKLCLTLCDPVCFGMPGFPVLHYLLEFAEIQFLGAVS